MGAAALVAIVLAGGVLAVARAVSGDDGPRSPQTVKWAKLSSSLAAVLRAELSGGRGLEVARASGLRVRDGRVLVVVEARRTRSAATAAVLAVRGRVVAAHANLVQALVAPRALGPLSRSTAVAFVRAPNAPALPGPALVGG